MSNLYLPTLLGSDDKSVGDVTAGRLRGSNDFDDLASLEAVIPGHRVTGLDPHELVLLQPVPVQQLTLLLRHQDDVLRHQLVLRDVDQKLGLQKLLQDVLWRHVHQRLLGTRGHAALDDDDGAVDVLLLHPFAVSSDGSNPDLGLFREENKHLVGGVVVVGHQNDEVRPCGVLFARLVAKLGLEMVQGLVQLVLGDQVASVVAEGHHGLPDPPELVRFGLVIHRDELLEQVLEELWVLGVM